MNLIKNSTVLIFLLGLSTAVFAHINPEKQKQRKDIGLDTEINFREDCTAAAAQIDMNINNVRARLLTGGDVWWDLQDGKYVVPAPPIGSGIPEVSSIFAGAVWLGGQDPAGNLKVAATDYRSGGNTDFFPGPLDPETGLTDLEICQQWDRFFKVTGDEVKQAIRDYDSAVLEGESYDEDSIPSGVKYWPGKGNPYFFEQYGFELPNTGQGLGAFWDEDQDGDYDPVKGDFPIIEIRGCEPVNRKQARELLPDEMTFWIYNDAGGPHSLSQGTAINMEVQVQAFAYATNDEINDMTFQRYKLINRATTDIRNTFFAMWVDPDLGCYTDDYSGCDVERSLAYTYNEDLLDGETGCDCPQGVNTYCDRIPIIGTDYFRGPLGPKLFQIVGTDTVLVNPDLGTTEFDTIVELGMSSFIYYNNGSVGTPSPQTTDPNNATDFYNYLQGRWRDGTPLTIGGDGFNPGSTDSTRYAFFDPPNDAAGWSMCTEGLPFGDRRTLQASGPFLLKPNTKNELIIGAVWVPDLDYPCPDISRLQRADDLAQALFDNCFDIIDGPDAPDVDIIELNREIILVLSNDTVKSNNAREEFSEPDILAPEDIAEEDALYEFEGYKIYQLANASVSAQELGDIDKARLIRQVDVKNGVSEIYNWNPEIDPNPASNQTIWTFEREVEGADLGVRHTFRILEDQFSSGDNKLVNHKKYYFMVLAYAYNNYETFDPILGIGQRSPYLEGRNNIRIYTGVPRPIVFVNQNAKYGDGARITRLDGVGVGGNFLDLEEGMYEAILDGSFDGRLEYRDGAGPIAVNIYNPLEVRDGKFSLEMIGSHTGGTICSLDPGVTWVLMNIETGETVASERSIDILNEQLLPQYGFSIAIGQTTEPGSNEPGNGVIGAVLDYADPAGVAWFGAITDDLSGTLAGPLASIFNFLKTRSGEVDFQFDMDQEFSSVGEGLFYPFWLCSAAQPSATDQIPFYVTPAWKVTGSHGFVRANNGLYNLNNVDIIFTSDKSKWSRCIVVETATEDYANSQPTIGNSDMFDLRQSPSVGQDGQPDGDGVGRSWFPGYAIDVETGKRLNIFFGENSVFNESLAANLTDGIPLGADMLFNPSDQVVGPQLAAPEDFIMGGQHFIYVTRQEYDECAQLHAQLEPVNNLFGKINALKSITWTSMTLLPTETNLLSYSEGVVPNDLTIKLRVDNPYNLETQFNGLSPNACLTVGGLPLYEFEVSGKMAEELVQDEYEGALGNVNVVPNPYYAYSAYETSQFTNTVKITNLPDRATVTIYSLDGKFIRQFRRDESPVLRSGANPGIVYGQTNPDIEWDLKNSSGISVASGVYLIHVAAPDLGEERTLKWFGINRKFDPSGL